MPAASLARMGTAGRQDAMASVEDDMARLMRVLRARIVDRAERFSPRLQPSGYLVIALIIKHHPITPAAIATHTAMDKSAVSRNLRALRTLGFVTSTPDPHDGRADLYSPTASALERIEKVRSDAGSVYDHAFSDWSDADLERFAELLQTFTDRLETFPGHR